jgi:oligopeptide transport system substrate-binding protein
MPWEHLSYLDAVVVSFNPSKQNEFFSFAKGEQSCMIGLDPSFKDNLLTKDGKLKEQFKNQFQFEVAPFLNTEFIGILVDSALDKTPLQNKKVRQAINYAIDRDKMIRYMKNNTVDVGDGGFVPQYLLAVSKKYYSYNPEKARQLLKDANYSNTEPLTLTTTSNYLDLAVFIQKELEDIGIKINIENVPGSSLSDLKTKSKTNFFRASWIADYADPENYLSVFYSKNWAPNGPNYYHFKNADFDKLYEQSLVEGNDQTRTNLYIKMQDIVMDEAPVVVLYYDKVIRLKANGMTGLDANPINMIGLKKVRLKN